MNLLKSPFRRTTAIVAGAFLGLAGTVALTGPASAHAPVIKGTVSCAEANGQWKVDWSVANDYGVWATVREVETSNAAAPDGAIKIGERVAPNYSNPLVGTSVLEASDGTAGLKVSLKWDDNFVRDATASVAKPESCAAPAPQPSASTTPSAEPEPSESTPSEPTPSESTPSESTPVPSASAPSPEPTPSYGEAEPIFEITCDSMTVGLDNPADGVEIPLVLEPSKGEKRTLVVKPGEKKTATFKASEGFKLKIYLEGYEDQAETIAWEAPEGCANGGGGSSDEPSLPLTGAAAGSIAAGAGVLLAAGVALFFFARRRKVKFTA
ncbi:LPXTG cell wall anchor domain-containing protein [Nucisporomicrobium flavum]|uniref:LPXTG cell wall anchor domain-containing protein n=1 Tax=Nucisporomicrobium flavum TaxID=2785915 RepID=UPI0018F4E788|nr:LPXTG cell wall anchor domain-containing protein [Nucisporomicrobium flavum]